MFKHNCIDKCGTKFVEACVCSSTILMQTNLLSTTIKAIQSGSSQLYNEYDSTIYI